MNVGLLDRSGVVIQAKKSSRVPDGWVVLPYGVGVGWTWSDPDWIGPNGQSPKPDPGEAQVYRKIVTPAEFVELFPAAAYLDIKNNLVGTNAEITQLYEFAFLKDTINLESPKMAAAMALLVALSSLTQEQADVILQGILE